MAYLKINYFLSVVLSGGSTLCFINRTILNKMNKHKSRMAKKVNTESVPIPTGLLAINKKPKIWSNIPSIAKKINRNTYTK